MPEHHGIRAVHQVGSYPAGSAEQAMREMLHAVGPCLRTLPDGETGERQGYVRPIVARLRLNQQAFTVVREGDWSSVADRLVLGVRQGHVLRADDLDLPYAEHAMASWPLFELVTREYGRTDLCHQVSIPSPTTMVFITLGPTNASFAALLRPRTVRSLFAMVRHYGAFADATTRQIGQVADRLPRDKIVFQIEAVAELVSATKAPAPVRTLIARVMARRIARVAMASPAGTRFGVHLCLGSLDNKAAARMPTAAPLVALGNAILQAWPAGRTLEYLHAPIATSDAPPPLAARFYRPLRRLRLPVGTAFHAGLVHEDHDRADQRRVLRLVEDNLGRQVGIAAPCGLGQRTPTAASTVLQMSAELAGRA